MKIATARKRTSKRWKTTEITWPEFVDQLRDPLRTAETVREYKHMSREERDDYKETAGGFVAGALRGPRRCTENVVERSMITLDADHAQPGAWENFACLYDYRMCVYSTHSHTPEKPRLRFVLPTDRPMTPDEYPAVARKVASWIGIEMMDPTTYEVARLMYWPTCPRDGEYVFHEQDGPLLSVDAVLAEYAELSDEPDAEGWRDSSRWPISSRETAARTASAAKAGEPTEKPGIVGLFCRAYDVPAAIDAFLSDIYEPIGGTSSSDGGRYTYIKGSTTGGAVVYNDGRFLWSNHATDPAAGHSVNAFDLVRIHKYGALDDPEAESNGSSVTALPSYKAMCAWAVDLPEIKEQMAVERMATMQDLEAGDVDAESGDAESMDAEQEETRDLREHMAWARELQLQPKTGAILPTYDNLLLILRNDPRVRGMVARDQFTDVPRRMRHLPWYKDETDESYRAMVIRDKSAPHWSDVDDINVVMFLESAWGLDAERKARQAIEALCAENAYHPVRQYLHSLTWDGTERVETALIRYLGAEDTPLVRAVTRKWMAAAVARVMQPGVKFDYCLLLTGGQGIGKSSFARILARGWLQDSLVDMNSKAGYEALQGKWIVELQELAGMKRSEVENVKAFISKSSDDYRKAYDRRISACPRQCVFIGTTNEVEFLKDRSGARRFWSVEVGQDGTVHLDQERLGAEVDQLWAEAVQIWKRGEPLYLETPELARALEENNEQFAAQDDLIGIIQRYLDTLLPDNWEELTAAERADFLDGSLPGAMEGVNLRARVCVPEIRVEALREPRRGGGNDFLSRHIIDIMNNLPGWKRDAHRRRFKDYGPQITYLRANAPANKWS